MREFVQNVDKTKVITVASIMRKTPTVNIDRDGPQAATRAMERNRISSCFVVDSERRLRGIVRIDDTVKQQKQNKHDLREILKEDVYTTYTTTAISDLLSTAFSTQYPIAVIDEENSLLGIVDRASIIAEVGGEEDNEASPVILTERLENGDKDEKEKATEDTNG